MKKTEDGWVAVHRQIQEWELYFSEKFTKTQAWIDLIILANHKRNTIFIRGNKVVMERGEIGWSEESLAKRWKWSRGKVRRYLEWLKTEQQIEHQQSSILSKIIVVNYDQYQPNGTTDRTTDGRQIEQQTDADKNDKNDKNDKKGTLASDDAESVKGVNQVFQVFYETINKRINFGNKTWRKAAEDLIKEFSLEEILAITRIACQVQGQSFAPTITNPLQLKEKLASLQIFIKKSQQPKQGAIQSL